MWFLVSRLEDADVRVWRGLGLFFVLCFGMMIFHINYLLLLEKPLAQPNLLPTQQPTLQPYFWLAGQPNRINKRCSKRHYI